MYTVYEEIETSEGTTRFFFHGAAQQRARDLGKAKTPYTWTRYGKFNDPRPASLGGRTRRYIISNLNGLYNHANVR